MATLHFTRRSERQNEQQQTERCCERFQKMLHIVLKNEEETARSYRTVIGFLQVKVQTDEAVLTHSACGPQNYCRFLRNSC